MTKLKQKIEKFLSIRVEGHEPDKILILTVIGIILFGLVMLTSASGGYAYLRYHDGYYFLKHQLEALLIGVLGCYFFSRYNYHNLRRLSFWMLVVSVLLLVLVFVPGLSSAANFKARSWINVFGFSLQPSELVKLTFLIYLAGWLEGRKQKQLEDFSQGLLPFLSVLGLIAILMLKQPDFGTFFIILVVSLTVFYVSGGNLKHLLGLGALGFLFLLLAVKAMPYQMDRINCYLEPSGKADSACYQVNQALIAIGSGGLWGRGFGESRQKMMYLPEVSGDSIFAIISEELGLFFSLAIVAGFIFLFWRGVRIAKRAPDNFGKTLALGISTWLAVQALINIGGMSNLLPMTGVPLPFISFGGSAIMAALIALGVLINISKQTRSQ